jgi:hypothetical protein
MSLGISATTATVLLAGSAISAGGAIAGGMIAADGAKKANASNNAATQKYIKQITAIANEAYGQEMAASSNLGARQGGLSGKYIKNVRGESDEFMGRAGKITGAAPDYATSLQLADEEWKGYVGDFENRSKTLVTDSAKQALTYNQENAQSFIDFANTLSDANLAQSRKMLSDADPFYTQQLDASGRVNLDLTRGLIPSELAAQVSRASAEGSVQSGTLGTSLNINRTARDFGLTSLDLMERGQKLNSIRSNDIYTQMIAGKQVNSEKIADWLGVSTENATRINAMNSAGLLDAQQTGVNMKLTGAGNILNSRNAANTNYLSAMTTGFGNSFGQDSATARAQAAIEAQAAANRASLVAGGAGQGLSNSYAAAANTQGSNLATAQMVQSTVNSAAGMASTLALYSSLGNGGGAGYTGLNGKTGFYGDAASAATATGLDKSQIGFWPSSGAGKTDGGYYPQV